jgi:hypothetical protein
MSQPKEKINEQGFHVKVSGLVFQPSVELFGHVILVEGYDVPGYKGCHALVALRDQPGVIVAVLTTEHHLQTLLETALSTGNLIAFRGQHLQNPPTPLGGTWSVDVYSIYGIILYNMV